MLSGPPRVASQRDGHCVTSAVRPAPISRLPQWEQRPRAHAGQPPLACVWRRIRWRARSTHRRWLVATAGGSRTGWVEHELECQRGARCEVLPLFDRVRRGPAPRVYRRLTALR